ncbi:hypothetical protein N7539_005786 [Penicillium diatomitis]|uniref:Uncharacterized protein n=1 Tax=Penicillium diatomitis TaxID=2819901 RepID=A0A9W9X5G4_9EURO|nr:uncharacterized protein N7539_005786 [Penicillium diatomitis]KAJ5483990.1 hypothetical protein N7539_005786 [Penicillium diatomitis]
MLPVIRDFPEAFTRSNCPTPEKTIKEDPIFAAKICPECESIIRRYDAQKRNWQRLTQEPPAKGPTTKMIIDSLLGNCKAAMDETGHWINQSKGHRPSDHASSDPNHAGSDHDKAPSS